MNYSVVAKNTSTYSYAGMAVDGNADIRDSLIVKNISNATDGVGGIGFSALLTHDVSIRNSVVADNTANGFPNDVEDVGNVSVVSFGFNFIETATNFDAVPTDIIGLDPKFDSIDLVGHRIQISIDPVSATIDSGSSAGIGETSIGGTVIGATPNIGGFTNNASNSLVFWSDDSGDIYRSDANFSYAQQIISNASTVLDIEVDHVNTRIYWLDSETHSIKSANFDGTSINTERLVSEHAVDFALDLKIDNDRFFVAKHGESPSILQYFENDVYDSEEEQRDGNLVIELVDLPSSIELDADSNTLYWSESNTFDARIVAIEIRPNGEDPSISSVMDVVTDASVIDNPYALAINDSTDMVYWSEPVSGWAVQHSPTRVPQNILIEFQAGVEPQAIAYDTQNDRLLLADSAQGTHWISPDLGTGTLGNTPHVVDRIATANVINDNPLIDSPENLTVPENETVISTVTSTFVAGPLEYSIVDGNDAEHFDIDSISGVLSFQSAKNFEYPVDFGTDNIYNLAVKIDNGFGGVDTQHIRVSVTDINDAPVLDPVSSPSVDENQITVLTVSGSDEDADTLVYSLVAEGDAELFEIDGKTGELTFRVAPDYENPNDIDGDNVYNVTVQVSDADGRTDTQGVAVTMTDINDIPVITSANEVSVDENQTMVLTLSSTDDDGDIPTYSLVDGGDAGLFDIDSTTGVLTFQSAPDHESPVDQNGDNVYSATVRIADIYGGSSTHDISVIVDDINDAPVLDPVSSPSVDENQITVLTVSGSDEDADTLVYSLVAEGDAELFEIDGETGELTFRVAPDYENPNDIDGDNVYNVTVQVSDADGRTDTQGVAVTMTDINDIPVITSANEVSVDENQTMVLTLSSTDDDGDIPTYSLVDGGDAGLFDIDSTTGVLTFQSAPDHESPVDQNGDNVYSATVRIADIYGGSSTHDISVIVDDINDAPVLDPVSSPSVDENQITVLTVSGSDEDADTLVYSLVAEGDAELFEIDGKTGELTFRVAPDYENPNDIDGDNVYNVTVQVSDADGRTDTQYIQVTIADVNEVPVIESLAVVNVDENQNFVINVNSRDDDRDPPEYSIVTRNDSGLFSIDRSSGVLSFATAPDFESPFDVGLDNVYNVTVRVADVHSSSSTQDLLITVEDVNEAPIVGSDENIVIAENTTLVLAVSSLDPDDDTVQYSLVAGDDMGLFEIDTATGVLSFSSAPDFSLRGDADRNNIYEVTILVSDGNGAVATQAIAVRVVNANDTPIIESASDVSIEENQSTVITVLATDDDSDDLVYSILSRVDSEYFTIDENSGILSFLTAPDFERPNDVGLDNVYNVTVQVDDSNGGRSFQEIAVTVFNVDELPSIVATQEQSVAENQTRVLTVGSVEDADDISEYSLVSGGDSGFFSIDASTGILTFLTAPDAEAPGDKDSNNIYIVTVEVRDGSSNTARQQISVTVTDVNDVPEIHSVDSINVAENQTPVLSVRSTDDDGDIPVYSLLSGEDAPLFNIDSASGSLSFLTAPDYEAPFDVGSDNVYNVRVQVEDGAGGSTSQSIEIVVTNVNENPIITSANRVNAPENTTNVLTVTSFDIDGDVLSYSLVDDNDAQFFLIDNKTGVLSFKSSPDFEFPLDLGGDNVYNLTVEIEDATGGTATQAITVVVTNVNEYPEIISANNISASENQIEVTTVTGTDPDGQIVEYSISGGADAEFFVVDIDSGLLTFDTAPDFEAPGDENRNNIYEVTVQISDGHGGAFTQAILITVTDMDEEPTIVPAKSLNILENQNQTQTVAVNTSDLDTFTYSISGGLDADLFIVDSDTGVLSFRSTQDFENPSDADGDNTYEVFVQTDDGNGGITTEVINVTLIDENDAPERVPDRQIDVQLLDIKNPIAVGDDAFFDEDGDVLSFSLTLADGQPLPDWIIFNQETAELSLGIVPLDMVSAKVLLTANDGRGGVATMLFDVQFIPDVEPEIQNASPVSSPFIASPEFIIDSPNQHLSLYVNSNQSTTVSDNSYTTSDQNIVTEDAIEPMTSVAADTLNGLLTSRFLNIGDGVDDEMSAGPALHDNVISEYLSGRRVGWSKSEFSNDIFDDSVSIANLFAMAQQQDPDMYAMLSDSSESRREEMESQIALSRGTVGTVVTTTSGLSIGYILYLLRGGAIMSSMLTSLPAWRFIDPLPIIGSLDGSLEADKESLQSIVHRSEKTTS